MDDESTTTAPEGLQEDTAENRMSQLIVGLTSTPAPKQQDQPDASVDDEPSDSEAAQPEGESEETTQNTGDDGESDQSTQPEATDYSATPEGRQRIELAKSALKRDRWSSAEIEALSPATLVQVGERRREAQAENDRLGNRLHEREAELEELRREHGIEDGYNDPELDELAQSNPELARRMAERIQAADDASNQADILAVEETLQSGMTDLQESYPQLATSEVRERVIHRAAALARSGAYENREASDDLVLEVLETATRIELGEGTMHTAQTKLLKQNHEQRLGQPDVGNATEDKSAKDPEDWALEQLEKGEMTPDQINKRYNQMLVSG